MAKSAPYRTGFCGIGLHEGTSPVGVSGGPLKVCVEWMLCACPCHEELTTMFEMTGMERMPQQNPKYSPPKSTFKMPLPHHVEAEPIIPRTPSNDLESTLGVVGPEALERPGASIVPPMVARSFEPTATGRAARGELEAWVREATDTWTVESKLDPNWQEVCTPEWIAKEVSKKHGVNLPSTGAITAVLVRWTELDFCSTEKKPTRFTGYTESGLEFGLEQLKARAKLKKRGKPTALIMERISTKKGRHKA